MASTDELYIQNLDDGKVYSITDEITVGRSDDAVISIKR